MKKIILLVVTACLSLPAFATDGKTTECFNMALSVPEKFSPEDSYPIYGQKLIKTDSILCVVEKNMVADDVDGIYSSGDIKITIKDTNVSLFK